MSDGNFTTLQNTESQQPLTFGPGDDSNSKILYNTESRIVALFLTKKNKDGNEVRFDILPWDKGRKTIARPPLSTIEFKESMVDGCMFGSMIVFDDRNWIDEFQFNGNEKAEIHFKIGKSQELIKLQFHIYDARSISDESKNIEINQIDERVSHWKLGLISSDIFLPNYNKTTLEIQEDFIGPLSGDNVSLINDIFEKYNLKVNKIEETRTGVWLKYDQVTYPWMKSKGQMRGAQLLKYLANYAWDGSPTNYHADYFVWQDRDGWNFRSVTNMVLDSKTGKNVKPVDGFTITIDVTNPNKILDFQVINEYNIQGLLDTGGLFSYYHRIDPNYDNPYLDFTDSRESFVEQDIFYNYKNNKNDIAQIEKYPLIADDFEIFNLTDSKSANFSSRVDDSIYGYYNQNFLNSPFNQSWDVYGRTMGGPWTKNTWQPQFDLVDLDVSSLKEIQLNIKGKLKKKREEYAKKKNIKRKWEVYRCTVCCHENGALGSTEDIDILNNPGPINGITYNLLYGATGIYGHMKDDKYSIVAAGSFTDTLNYQAGNTFYERGLTYSYDLTKAPYNETLGQFFNLTGPTAPEAYTKFVIERATKQYQIIIDKTTERLNLLRTFVNNNVTRYKTKADDIFGRVQITTLGDEKRPLVAPTTRPIDLLQGLSNRFIGDAVVGEQLTDWPITSYEFGMVPHSRLDVNTGIGQVIFGNDPNSGSQQNTVSFRNAAAAGSCLSRTCGANGSQSFTCETCVGGCSSCSPNQLFITSCPPTEADIHNYFIQFGDCPDTGNPGSGLSACARCVDGLVSCDAGSLNCASSGGYPTTLAACQQLVSQTFCNQSGGGGIDPGNYQYCCAFDNSGFNACSAKDYNTCLDSGGVPVTQCSDCSYQGGGIQGPPGPPGPRGPRGPTGPTGPTGPSNLPTQKDVKYIPECSFQECSNDPIVRGYIKHTTAASVASYSPIYVYAAPYLWDTGVSDWSFYDYGTESGLIPGVVDGQIKDVTKLCLYDCGCYNTTCTSSVALEVLRRTCVAEIELLQVELELMTQIKTLISSNYEQAWKTGYAEWYSRNSFFFSKKPGSSIFKNSTRNTIQSPTSLQNIKSITRKEVRGSRYELLSNKVGITGASSGAWLYNIFFGGSSGSTYHPYYNQGYSGDAFITSRNPHSWFGFFDADATDDPTFFVDQGEFTYIGQPTNSTGQVVNSSPDYKGQEYIETASLHMGKNKIYDVSKVAGMKSYGYAQSDLSESISNYEDEKKFRNTFNFYNTLGKKPANIKKEEISSYVRVEFATPIGLDRIKDFPNGFVRDAGVEYFLPYLVNLTPGPFGRQGVKYNVAVIGMDPYGFDVAVKKIKDDIPTNRKLQGIDKGNYYDWWNHDTGSVLSKTSYLSSDYNGMDLWPEIGFETDYPYYAYDASQEDLHGGGYDMDFHMGGGYYFENESQNWMESLYHYGMSSNKQFDPLYRTSVVGSYILPNSYRKLKPHRSWWSFFIPRNLFIPIRFANMFKTPNTKARDLFGGKALFTLSPNYWRTWYGSEFENWIDVSKNKIKTLLETKAEHLNFMISDHDTINGETVKSYISAYKENSSNLNGYFRDSLMNYLAANYILYRPVNDQGLVTTDLWKYDLSGETEYGIVSPPVDTEYDFFDRNFAVQFVVHAKGGGTRTCKDIGLECANPKAIKDGPIISAGGCTANPYCNCPAKNLMPSEKEPTYLELQKLYNEMNECALIESVLGKDWLGCEFSDPTSTCSCNCPEQGINFPYYLAMTRTYSTFWNCPLDLPLRRTAQIAQLQAQRIKIRIPPNSKVKIGSLIEVINANDKPEFTENRFKKISGTWFVYEIDHLMTTNAYLMELHLMRNSLHYDPNSSSNPKGIFRDKPKQG